jgi:peptidoglycan hydrolase CwlO-like protein
MSPIEILDHYWQILATIVMFIIGYFKLRYDVESLQHSDIAQEAKIASLQEHNQEIRENIATIRQKIDNTDNNINDIRRVLERLDERLHK